MYSINLRVVSRTKMVRFRIIVLSCCFFFSMGALLVEIDGFWNNYLLDIAFPAFWYLTLRGISKAENMHPLLQKLSPSISFSLLIGVTFILEIGQYFGFYWGTYDPIDFLAYMSLLGPCFLIEIWGLKNQRLGSV